jgi:hypothetical protein
MPVVVDVWLSVGLSVTDTSTADMGRVDVLLKARWSSTSFGYLFSSVPNLRLYPFSDLASRWLFAYFCVVVVCLRFSNTSSRILRFTSTSFHTSLTIYPRSITTLTTLDSHELSLSTDLYLVFKSWPTRHSFPSSCGTGKKKALPLYGTLTDHRQHSNPPIDVGDHRLFLELSNMSKTLPITPTASGSPTR